jgi:isocitrate/isopropylmalate dehydrogenase
MNFHQNANPFTQTIRAGVDTMANKYKVAVLPGDGIGPEVTSEAVKILNATGLNFELLHCDIGGSAYLRNGDALPPESIEACKEADAVLFGAVGHDYVAYEIPRRVLIHLRLDNDAYANIRPLKRYPRKGESPRGERDIDLVIVRDNAEGFSLQHSGMLAKTLGTDRRVITQYGAQRIIQFAVKYALQNNRKKITCVDQSHWLYSDKFFRSVFDRLLKDYETLERRHQHVDVAAMMLASRPEDFDVIVTPDIYGDILSAVVVNKVGGVGMAPSACIGDSFAYFEPIHGTAWDIAGKGVANPLASILSAGLMLDYLGEGQEARVVEDAVSVLVVEGETLTSDLGGSSGTAAVGDMVVEKMRSVRDGENPLLHDPLEAVGSPEI